MAVMKIFCGCISTKSGTLGILAVYIVSYKVVGCGCGCDFWIAELRSAIPGDRKLIESLSD